MNPVVTNVSRSRREPGFALAWVLAALATYGSLFPFDFSEPELLGRSWTGFWSDWRVWTSLGDVVGNVILFVPLGVAQAWALTHRSAARGTWLIHGALAVLLALLLQVAQMFIPSRDPALADVIWNAMGLGFGMALGSALHRWRGPEHARDKGASHAAMYLLIAWVALELAPLMPTIDWQNIKNAIKPLMRLEWSMSKSLHTVSFALVLASLLSMVIDPTRRRVVWPATAMLLAAVTLAKPFIAGKSLTLAWLLGLLLGLMLVAVVVRARSTRLAQTSLLALWVAIVVNGLAPFQLRTPPAAVDWVPFRSMLSGSMEANVWSLIATVVVALAWLRLADEAVLPRRLSVPVVLLTSAAVEGLQTHVAGRTSDVTPVLLIGLTAWLFKADFHRPSRRDVPYKPPR